MGLGQGEGGAPSLNQSTPEKLDTYRAFCPRRSKGPSFDGACFGKARFSVRFSQPETENTFLTPGEWGEGAVASEADRWRLSLPTSSLPHVGVLV